MPTHLLFPFGKDVNPTGRPANKGLGEGLGFRRQLRDVFVKMVFNNVLFMLKQKLCDFVLAATGLFWCDSFWPCFWRGSFVSGSTEALGCGVRTSEPWSLPFALRKLAPCFF